MQRTANESVLAAEEAENGLRSPKFTRDTDSVETLRSLQRADGRMIAYFSRRAQNPGLYVMPILIPARTQGIAVDVGSSLR
jgi:hypothetical protein